MTLPSFNDELYEKGIESYMNDAPIDFGVQNTVDDKNNPAFGTALGPHLARQGLLLDSLSS